MLARGGIPSAPIPQVWLGGSFDPVHLGHLWLAHAVQQRLPQACIRFMPTPGSPLKQTQTCPRHRLAMLRLALRDTPFSIDRTELQQPAPAYTIDTLARLRQRYGPDCPLIWIIGADGIDSLPRWKGGYEILQQTHLWVFPRPASSNQPDRLHLPVPLLLRQADHWQNLTRQAAGCIWLDERTPPVVSSSQLRQQLLIQDLAVLDLTLPRVAQYIKSASLYGLNTSHVDRTAL